MLKSSVLGGRVFIKTFCPLKIDDTSSVIPCDAVPNLFQAARLGRLLKTWQACLKSPHPNNLLVHQKTKQNKKQPETQEKYSTDCEKLTNPSHMACPETCIHTTTVGLFPLTARH